MKWLVLKRHDNEMSWKSFMHGWLMMSWNELDLEHERRWLSRLVWWMYTCMVNVFGYVIMFGLCQCIIPWGL